MRYILVLFLLSACTPKCLAQKSFEKGNVKSDTTFFEVIKAGKVIASSKFSELPVKGSHSNRYIVEFNLKPFNLREYKKSGNFNKLLEIKRLHQRFENDFQALQKTSQHSGIGSGRISHKYSIALNGAAVEDVDSAFLSKLKSLPYVKQIFPDNLCKIVDNESNELIRADHVWSDLGITGKGVTIGIIDTGIDSAHHVLSGKVVCGYNFVSDNQNFFDDHGHGTHCAGIAAANGETLKGVAPDAKLMAIKVLNSGGSGYDSWIIAGIEYALDPDKKPETDDGANVISMSLGYFGGNPSDALSTAVDNAFKNGVLCVVAAGNDGNRFFNVSSPGCAKHALTVGAVEKSLVMAWFSSWGPAPLTYTIKPEVVAPGVDILSAVPNNQFQSMNGTSMATPHVAGIAALLLEQNPDYSPEVIKSLIVNSSKEIAAQSIWAQGNGCVDAFNASTLTTAVYPPILSLGLVDNQVDTWFAADTFTVFNLSGSPLDYNAELSHSFPGGLTASISKNHVTLNPGDTAKIILRVVVQNTAPVPESELPTYRGSLNIFSALDSVSVPFAFIKGKTLRLEYDFVPHIVLIHNNNDIIKILFTGSKIHEVLLPEGLYDVITCYGESFMVNEQIEVNSSPVITISQRDAKHLVSFLGKDIEGNNLPTTDASPILVLNKESGIGLKLFRIVFGYTRKTEKFLSDISDRYEFQISPSTPPANSDGYNWYNFPFTVTNLQQTANLDVDRNDFREIIFDYSNIKNRGDSLFYSRGAWSLGVGGYYDAIDNLSPSAHFIRQNYLQSIQMLPIPNSNFIVDKLRNQRIYSKPVFSYGSFDPWSSRQIHQIPEFYVDSNKSSLVATKTYWHKDLLLPINGNKIKIPLGTTPLTFLPTMYVQDGQFFYYKTEPALRFSFMDFPVDSIPFSLSSSNGIELLDTIMNLEATTPSLKSFQLQNKPYTFKAQYSNFWVNNIQGFFNVETKFTPENYHKLFQINNLMLICDSMPTNIISSNFPSYLTWSIYNAVDSAMHQLQIRKQEEVQWHSLIYTINSNYKLIAQLPDTLEKGYYSLRYLHDLDSENYSDHRIEPAFYVASDLEFDSLALVDLYRMTKGEEWTNKTGWLENPLSEWYGVTIHNHRVTEIALPSNNLVGFIPHTLLNLKSLAKFDISGNAICQIPSMANIQSLNKLFVQNNKLGFNDIIPNLTIANFVYSPQDSVGFSQVISKSTGDDVTFSAYFDNSSCSYQWFRDGEPISDPQNFSSFSLTSLDTEDSGNYHCIIKHPLLQNFVLVSRYTTLRVQPKCFERVTQNITFAEENPFGGFWIDFDNDGDDDLYSAGNNFLSRLYRNNFVETGEPLFEDITDDSFSVHSPLTSGCSWGDYNSDGFADLYLSSFEGSNYLYVNQLGNSFDPVYGYEFLQKAPYEIANAKWVDYNNDGFTDLYVPHQTNNGEIFRNNGDLTFTREPHIFLNQSLNPNSNIWSNFNNDIMPDLVTEKELFLNLGEGFELTYPFSSIDFNPVAFSSADFDNDGDLDLFAANQDIMGVGIVPGMLFENLGNNQFSRLSNLTIAKYMGNATGSSWGDFDNDGDIDLFVCYAQDRNILWKNLLQENGIVDFEEVSFDELAEHWGISFGCSNSDFDCDGDLDIFIANASIWAGNSNYGKNILLKNMGSSNSWISIGCKGIMSNTMALGTRLMVKANINGNDVWQTREISSGTGYGSQNSLRVHFGLGNAVVIDSLKILWSSGYMWDTANVQVNQFLNLIENDRRTPMVTFAVSDGTNPIPGVEIYIDGNTNPLLTNSNGIVSTLLQNGPHSYYINHPGYEYFSDTFTIKFYDQSHTINLQKITSVSTDYPVCTIYPNPFHNEFKISGISNFTFEVFDVNGRTVCLSQIPKNTTIVNLTDLPGGVYFVRVNTSNSSQIIKLVKL